MRNRYTKELFPQPFVIDCERERCVGGKGLRKLILYRNKKSGDIRLVGARTIASSLKNA
jgi:hypothetical protein